MINCKIKKGYVKRQEVVFDKIREVGECVNMDVEDSYFGIGANVGLFRDFVECMTRRKANCRLTAEQALRHDWIRSFRW